MKIEKVVCGMYAANAYIINDELVIDPGDDIEKLKDAISAPKAIMLTHGHFDHIGAVRELMDADTKLVIHRLDAPMLGDPELNAGAALLMRNITAPDATDTVKEGDEPEFAGLKVKVLHTPGHTPGAKSYFFNVSDGKSPYVAALHGGMGINTLCKEFLDKYSLSYTLREDFVRSMLRLNEEKVDIFLGNHMQHNHTEKKAELVKAGNAHAFVDGSEWQPYNLWCIENLENMIRRENEQ